MTPPLHAQAGWGGLVRLFLATGTVLLVLGCGNHKLAPPLSPGEAAAKAIQQYDQDGDGLLDATELEKCPALKASLQRIDTNKDGKLSREEIAARLTKMVESGIALLSISCTILLDDQPLEGATVRL